MSLPYQLTVIIIDPDLESVSRFRSLVDSISKGNINLMHRVNEPTLAIELSRIRPDVVFLSYENGAEAELELLIQTRALGFEQPVIILADQENEGMNLEVMRAGGDDCLVKGTLDGEGLERSIRRVMNRRRRISLAASNLQKSEERYRRLFENAPVGILLADPDGKIHEANIKLVAIMEKLFAMKSFPRNILRFPPFARSDFVEDYHACMQTNELVESDCSLHGSDHRTVHLRYQLMPVLDYEDNVAGVQAVITDVTAEKNAELALKESKRRLMDILTNVDLLAVMLDINGNIVFCNNYFENLTGWKSDELFGANWYSHFDPGSRGRKKNLEQLLHPDGNSLKYERAIETRGGERRTIHWSNTLLKDREDVIYGIARIGQDITERLKAEQEIERLSHTIIQVQEEERSRISMELHDDIGQSLFAIKLKLQKYFSELNNGAGKPFLDETLPMIDFIANYIRRFSHELSPIGLKNLGLPQAVKRLVESYEVAGSPIDFTVNIDDLDAFFPDNWEINFYRIIQEALNNITKHAEATEVEILVHNPGNRLLVRVMDNGKGVNLNAAGAVEEEGNRGLGLLIMRQRARLLQANFNIRSKIGAGTEITIEIPRRTIATAAV